MNPIKQNKFILLWSQIGWFGCIYFEKLNWSLLTILFPIVAWIYLVYLNKDNYNVYLKILVLSVLGITFDYTMFKFQIISFPFDLPTLNLFNFPLWLISMWLLFVTSLASIDEVLKQNFLLSLVVGMIVGPLTYRAGQSFDVLYFNGPLAIICYSIFWGLFLAYGLKLIRISNGN